MDKKALSPMTFIMLLLLCAAMAGEARAALSVYGDVLAGNRDYRQNKFKEAEEAYGKALARKPGWEIPLFNRGNALYRQKKYDEAIKEFNQNIKKKGATLAEKAFYNKGNAFYNKKEYEKAIDSYKEALRRKSDDLEAKFNLELAMKMQQQQQNKDKKDQNKDKDKGKDKDKNQSKDKDKNKDQAKNKDKDKDKGKDKDKDNGEGPQDLPDKGEISKEQALRVLKAFQKNEEQNMKKIRARYQVRQTDKDW
jgi:tetratricopeptide (TPR) repeat protein